MKEFVFFENGLIAKFKGFQTAESDDFLSGRPFVFAMRNEITEFININFCRR